MLGRRVNVAGATALAKDPMRSGEQEMNIKKHIGKMDRTKFALAHNGTVYVQDCFGELKEDDIRPDTFQYMPCWAIIDPGMKVEPHQHPIPEFYVFTSGEGVMQLGEQMIPVRSGMAVNIPSEVIHSVTNDKAAVEPLIWVSIGLLGKADRKGHLG